MAIFRSFKDFIADKFYNNMFTAIKRYVYSNREKLDLHSYSVSNIDTATLSDISVKSVGIDDREGMCIAFDVAVEAEIEICEYSNRKGNRSDFCTQWFLLCCEGNLSTGLPSFIIKMLKYIVNANSKRTHCQILLFRLYMPTVWKRKPKSS